MRIIGIDPGSICCGYGIVETGRSNTIVHVASGEIKLKQKDPIPERLKTVHETLSSVIDEYKPSHLSLEKIFYHKSIRSAFTLGSVRGVVMLLSAQKGLTMSEYNPTEVKMALTGYGRAEKRQVQEMVKIILNLKSSKERMSEDRSDALALCICHLHSAQVQ
jgi:crossover junction endodeoxyribonuclease RuvC